VEVINRKQKLHDLGEQVEIGKQMMGKGGYVAGKALKEIKEGGFWVEEAKSFEEYVEMAHGIKKSWAYGLIGIVDKFSTQLETKPPADASRLVKLLPYTSQDNAEELYGMALTTPAQAFENNLRNLRGKVAPDQCTGHAWEPWRKCSICGKMTPGEAN